MRVMAASVDQDHVAYYAAVATVFSFLFISLNVQLLGPTRLADTGPSGRIPWLAVVGFGVLLLGGVVFPLAVLAGYLPDTGAWRVLGFICTMVELVLSLFVAGLVLAEPRGQRGSDQAT